MDNKDINSKFTSDNYSVEWLDCDYVLVKTPYKTAVLAGGDFESILGALVGVTHVTNRALEVHGLEALEGEG